MILPGAGSSVPLSLGLETHTMVEQKDPEVPERRPQARPKAISARPKRNRVPHVDTPEPVRRRDDTQG